MNIINILKSYYHTLNSNHRFIKINFYKLGSENKFPNKQQAKLIKLFEYDTLNSVFADHSIISVVTSSKSQLCQDLLALLVCKQIEIKSRHFNSESCNKNLGNLYNNFFVEFGACDGIAYSNTWLLEKFYSWNGLLAEPARIWHSDLKKNRTVNIDLRGIGGSPSVESFYENFNKPTFSRLSTYVEVDGLTYENQEKINHYEVEVITLNELLDYHKAPKYIDYLSIDTEGNELSILTNFNFDMYSFTLLTIEHNNRPDRDLLYNLLKEKGYIQLSALNEFSGGDGWFLNQKYASFVTNLL